MAESDVGLRGDDCAVVSLHSLPAPPHGNRADVVAHLAHGLRHLRHLAHLEGVQEAARSKAKLARHATFGAASASGAGRFRSKLFLAACCFPPKESGQGQ